MKSSRKKIAKPIQLTSEQQRAMNFIETYGAIVRYEGGFWSKPDAPMDGEFKKSIGDYPQDHVGTNTIKSLLKKGVIKTSKEKQSQYGKFPVECVKA